MLSKLILIGLFALKNNRTIREPKSPQRGEERQFFVPACFFRVVTGSTGNWAGLLYMRLREAQASVVPIDFRFLSNC